MLATQQPPSAPFAAVKVLDLGYTAGVQVVLAFCVGTVLDAPFGRFDPRDADERSLLWLVIGLCLQYWLIMTTNYVVRNIRIRSPLQGVAGLDHFRLDEVQHQTMFATVLMFSQRHFLAKLAYLIERIGNDYLRIVGRLKAEKGITTAKPAQS